MTQARAITKKGDQNIVLDLENFSHLEYGVVEIEKADLPSGGSNGR